jgi:hypothetical protein
MSDINKVMPPFDSKNKDLIDDLFAAFWGNYKDFRDGKILPDCEDIYKALGAPGHLQYAAFQKFFSLCAEGDKVILNFKKQAFMYDFASMHDEPAMLQFVRKLSQNADPQNNEVYFAFGSFWGNHHQTRKEIIDCFPQFIEKGINVHVNTQAKQDEEYLTDIIAPVKKNSMFGIPSRIPIHFIRDKDFVFFEFPHTESTYIRLNMLLCFDDIKLKKEKTKQDLICFFDSLIKEALN